MIISKLGWIMIVAKRWPGLTEHRIELTYKACSVHRSRVQESSPLRINFKLPRIFASAKINLAAPQLGDRNAEAWGPLGKMGLGRNVEGVFYLLAIGLKGKLNGLPDAVTSFVNEVRRKFPGGVSEFEKAQTEFSVNLTDLDKGYIELAWGSGAYSADVNNLTGSANKMASRQILKFWLKDL